MNKDLSIEALQKRLDERGIRDIKVFWSGDKNKISINELEKELSFILNTYIDGDVIPLGLFGDGTGLVDKFLVHKGQIPTSTAN